MQRTRTDDVEQYRTRQIKQVMSVAGGGASKKAFQLSNYLKNRSEIDHWQSNSVDILECTAQAATGKWWPYPWEKFLGPLRFAAKGCRDLLAWVVNAELGLHRDGLVGTRDDLGQLLGCSPSHTYKCTRILAHMQLLDVHPVFRQVGKRWAQAANVYRMGDMMRMAIATFLSDRRNTEHPEHSTDSDPERLSDSFAGTSVRALVQTGDVLARGLANQGWGTLGVSAKSRLKRRLARACLKQWQLPELPLDALRARLDTGRQWRKLLRQAAYSLARQRERAIELARIAGLIDTHRALKAELARRSALSQSLRHDPIPENGDLLLARACTSNCACRVCCDRKLGHVSAN